MLSDCQTGNTWHWIKANNPHLNLASNIVGKLQFGLTRVKSSLSLILSLPSLFAVSPLRKNESNWTGVTLCSLATYV